MEDQIKNLWDVVLTISGMAGAMVAFWFSLRQWRRGQAWQRAEKLDKFIEKFETDPLLRLAATILDWTDRDDTKLDGNVINIRNNDALLALRSHRTTTPEPTFTDEQAKFRDAYDALLAFLSRLELSVSMGLIDAEPTRSYFLYWLKRLLKFSAHPDREKVLGDLTPASAVADYIKTFGDVGSVIRLCKVFRVLVPEELVDAHRSSS